MGKQHLLILLLIQKKEVLAAPVRTEEHITESAEVTPGTSHHEAPRGRAGGGTKRKWLYGGGWGGDGIWIYSAALAMAVTVTTRVAERCHGRKAARLWGLERQGEWREGKRL